MKELSRRSLLKAAGAAGLGLAVPPVLWRQPAIAGAAPPEQIHLQFGNDAARTMTVSWTTTAPVSRPRVRFGDTGGGLGSTVTADTSAFRDAHSGSTVYCHHARLTGLRPASAYAYQVVQDGSDPVSSAFRTAPEGRTAFRFTSFGDQCTGTAGDGISTPQGSWVVDQVEAMDPLFHLVNGDLSYANSLGSGSNPAFDRSVIWDHWFTNKHAVGHEPPVDAGPREPRERVG